MTSLIEAKLKSQRAEMQAANDRQRAEMMREVVSTEQLAALQSRLEKLHATKLLSEDELYSVEDSIGDYIELKASVSSITAEMVHANRVVGTVLTLCALCEGLAADGAFARQLKRKFV